MKSTRFVLSSIVFAALLVSCGSEEVGEPLPEPAAQGDDVDQPDVEPQPSEPSPDGSGDTAMTEIGRANVGGTVVDPQPHPVDRYEIAESSPEQITLTFTAGDPNCTAADAVATGGADEVLVELFVGITEDALTRSCVSGEIEQTISIALDEPLGGRDLVVVEPAASTDDAPASAPLPGDGSIEAMAAAIIGLDVDTAEQQIVDAGWAFRVSEIDGEPQALTMDERDDRLNVKIDDGVVTNAEVF